MSWLSDRLGIHVNSINDLTSGRALKETGHALGQVATNPLVDAGLAGALALTGVGIPASAAILGGTKGLGSLIAPGGNIGDAAQGAVSGGAEGALASGLAGSLLGGGGAAGEAAGRVGSAEVPGIPGIGGVQSATDIIRGIPGGTEGVGQYVGGALGLGGGGDAAAGAAGGGGKNLLQKGLGWLTGNGGSNALGLAQALNAAYLQKQSSDAANKAISGIEENYGERARLRGAGIEGMLNPITPDLSSLLVNSGPYAQGLPPIAPASRYTGLGAATAPARMG